MQPSLVACSASTDPFPANPQVPCQSGRANGRTNGSCSSSRGGRGNTLRGPRPKHGSRGEETDDGQSRRQRASRVRLPAAASAPTILSADVFVTPAAGVRRGHRVEYVGQRYQLADLEIRRADLVQSVNKKPRPRRVSTVPQNLVRTFGTSGPLSTSSKGVSSKTVAVRP